MFVIGKKLWNSCELEPTLLPTSSDSSDSIDSFESFDSCDCSDSSDSSYSSNSSHFFLLWQNLKTYCDKTWKNQRTTVLVLTSCKEEKQV